MTALCAADGRWTVCIDRTDESGTVLENKILTTDALVLAAGSLGTTRLLVRAAATDRITDLPDELGRGWGTNADRIYMWTDLAADFGAVQGGPVVYGVSSGRGEFAYDDGRDDAVLRWPHEGDAGIQNNHIDPAVRRIAGDAAVVVDTNTIVPSTWHPLGGANMGSVCDLDGRVLGQRGLYVLDGALMPGNAAACNPSMAWRHTPTV